MSAGAAPAPMHASGSKRMVAVAAVAMLMLTGCTSASSDASEATEHGPTAVAETPTPTVEPAPTPTPTPTEVAADPADPSGWLIDAAGIGPIQRGAAYPGVIDGLSAYSVEPSQLCPELVYLEREGAADLLVTLDDSGGSVYRVAVFGSARAPEELREGGATEAGIGVGASEAELLAAYPELELVIERPSSTVYAVGDDAAGWIVFSVVEGLVTSIEAADTRFTPAEQCA